jgi:hypothetical protein
MASRYLFRQSLLFADLPQHPLPEAIYLAIPLNRGLGTQLVDTQALVKKRNE